MDLPIDAKKLKKGYRYVIRNTKEGVKVLVEAPAKTIAVIPLEEFEIEETTR